MVFMIAVSCKTGVNSIQSLCFRQTWQLLNAKEALSFQNYIYIVDIYTDQPQH